MTDAPKNKIIEGWRRKLRLDRRKRAIRANKALDEARAICMKILADMKDLDKKDLKK